MRKILLLTSLLIWILSCNKKQPENDNLYDYKDYIQSTTSGIVSVTTPINIHLTRKVEKWEEGSPLEDNLISISPEIRGKIILKTPYLISFETDEPLDPSTEYTVQIHLDKIFNNQPESFQTYTFQFKTRDRDFYIQTGSIQSYSPDWQYLEGELLESDYIPEEKIKEIITAEQDGKKLPIHWKVFPGNISFVIDSIARKEDDSDLIIHWDGKAAGINRTGKEILHIPGKNNFTLMGIRVIQQPDQYLIINFSDPLLQRQNFQGLVKIEEATSLKYTVEGNELRIYPESRLNGNLMVEVFRGIKNVNGQKLKTPYRNVVSFEMLKPKIELIDKGVFLPNSQNLRINFKAVNVRQVTVRVIKIFEDNVLQFLQKNDIQDKYNIREVGRILAKKTITLIDRPELNQGRWKAYSVDLARLIQVDPGAIYRVELSFGLHDVIYDCVQQNKQDKAKNNYDGDYQENDSQDFTYVEYDEEEENRRERDYWDNLLYSYKRHYWDWEQENNPCHPAYYNDKEQSINVLGSNLGLIVKKGGDNKYYVTVTDILTANPVSGAKVYLYNYQKQEIATLTTDSKGMAAYKPDANAYFAIAKKGNNKTYLKLSDGKALSVSKFNVGGKVLKKGLQGVIYGERGVWRPGDTLHLSFVLNDKYNPIPEGHPIRFELRDEREGIVYKQIDHYKSGRFYVYHIPTDSDAPTGTWRATVRVGGASFSQNIPIATVKPNRLKIQLDFGQDKIISTREGLNGKLKAQWLHGAPAANLKADISMKLRSAKTVFPDYSHYLFHDPVKKYYPEEIDIFEGKLNSEGFTEVYSEFPETSEAPGMLQAAFYTRVFEKGGEFSMDVMTRKISPYSRYIGLLPAEPNAYGEYDTGKEVTFGIVSVDALGKPVQAKNLELRVYKLDWQWWWDSSYSNLAHYISSEYHEQIYDKILNTRSDGKTHFTLKIPDERGGRYLIRIYDPESGHATGLVTYFYKDWWRTPQGTDGQEATILILSKDKDLYHPGDKIHLTFPSPATGRALISIENGSQVINRYWEKTTKGETHISIPVTTQMAPNVFIHVSLLQPHAETANDLPIRLYGIIPVKVENSHSHLTPVIKMSEKLSPEQTYQIQVSEAKGLPMTYTLAVVDEGLLDLTRYRTPDLYHEFNRHQALGVLTWDMFDQVIGAYAGRLNKVFAIGGDEEIQIEKGKKPNRFKPVVSFLGPFRLKKGQRQTHRLKMPNYIGSVRVMLVAGNRDLESYGSAEKTVPVTKPLMVLAGAPRRLSPGETFTLPINVFAMEEGIHKVEVNIQTTGQLTLQGKPTQNLSFDKTGDKMLYYKLKTSDKPGNNTIRITARSGKLVSAYELQISSENPNPFTSRVTEVELPPGLSKDLDLKPFGTPGTNSINLEAGTLPPMDYTRRMEYLIKYPHGCVEQTTSSVFPQLYLADIFDLDAGAQTRMKENIINGIKRLSHFQTVNGGMAYWPGMSEADDWGSSYAGHFLLEAEKKGYSLPIGFKSRWINYQRQAARMWSPSNYPSNGILQAYRLYTLALAGKPEFASMNRLREMPDLNNQAKWPLASAYALAGQTNAAKQIIQTAKLDFSNNFHDYYTYGNPLRNKAMALQAMILTGDKRAMQTARDISKMLTSEEIYNTQSTSYALLSLSKLLVNNGGKSMNFKYVINGEPQQVNTTKSATFRELPVKPGRNKLHLENPTDKHLFIRITTTGKLPVGEQMEETRNLLVQVHYTDGTGKVISPDRLRQGTDFTAHVKVINDSDRRVSNIALTQIFPGGWEILNTSFTSYSERSSSASSYSDIRDDRIYEYFDLGAGKSKTFEVRLNAAYPGRYYLFGVQAEAMYDPDYLTRTKGQWVEVIRL